MEIVRQRLEIVRHVAEQGLQALQPSQLPSGKTKFKQVSEIAVTRELVGSSPDRAKLTLLNLFLKTCSHPSSSLS